MRTWNPTHIIGGEQVMAVPTGGKVLTAVAYSKIAWESMSSHWFELHKGAWYDVFGKMVDMVAELD